MSRKNCRNRQRNSIAQKKCKQSSMNNKKEKKPNSFWEKFLKLSPFLAAIISLIKELMKH